MKENDGFIAGMFIGGLVFFLFFLLIFNISGTVNKNRMIKEGNAYIHPISGKFYTIPHKFDVSQIKMENSEDKTK